MWELEQQVEELVNQYIEESEAACVGARDVGLDYRCGMVYVSVAGDFVAVSGGGGSINYYGGFEYIDSDQIITIGHMTFYSGEASRVQACIEHYIESTENKNNNQEGQGEATC
jgi:hypothetical protein